MSRWKNGDEDEIDCGGTYCAPCITSTFNITPSLERKLEKTINFLGQKITPKLNIPFIEIYNDGSTNKKIIIE